MLSNEKSIEQPAYTVSEKGIALLAAIESGLLPMTEEGADDVLFNRFWDIYQKRLQREGGKKRDDLTRMLQQKCEQCAYNRAEYRTKNLRTAISAFLGYLLGAGVILALRLL